MAPATACQSLSPPLVSAPPASPAGCRGCGSCSPRGRRQRVLPLLLLSSPRPHGFVRQRYGRGARLGADPAEAGGTGVHLPGAVPGPGSRAEPRLGDGGPPVLPVPVGVLPQARQLGELALRVHAAQRWVWERHTGVPSRLPVHRPHPGRGDLARAGVPGGTPRRSVLGRSPWLPLAPAAAFCPPSPGSLPDPRVRARPSVLLSGPYRPPRPSPARFSVLRLKVRAVEIGFGRNVRWWGLRESVLWLFLLPAWWSGVQRRCKVSSVSGRGDWFRVCTRRFAQKVPTLSQFGLFFSVWPLFWKAPGDQGSLPFSPHPPKSLALASWSFPNPEKSPLFCPEWRRLNSSFSLSSPLDVLKSFSSVYCLILFPSSSILLFLLSTFSVLTSWCLAFYVSGKIYIYILVPFHCHLGYLGKKKKSTRRKRCVI